MAKSSSAGKVDCFSGWALANVDMYAMGLQYPSQQREQELFTLWGSVEKK